jgi:ABC-type transport system involved in Fe-S cluster assembly fused permease/ATPase subunit
VPRWRSGILGILKASEVANAIALGDKATISRAPGVGKRVAERILSELKDKAPGLASIDQDTIAVSQTVADNVAARPVAEAVSALTNLGYGQPQASAAVAKAMQSAGEDATTETLIRLGPEGARGMIVFTYAVIAISFVVLGIGGIMYLDHRFSLTVGDRPFAIKGRRIETDDPFVRKQFRKFYAHHGSPTPCSSGACCSWW